jgi:hypothetical protein
VLSPPWLPPPWDQPRAVPLAPQPQPAQPSAQPPATPKKRTRAAQPVYQTSARPTPVQQRPQPVASSPERRYRRTLIGGLIAVVLLVCFAPALLSAVRAAVGAFRAGTATAVASSPPLAKPPTLSYPAPSSIVAQAQPSAFLLPVGTGVGVTDGANQWTATVVDAVWLATACEGTFHDPGPVVVVGIRFDVGAGQLTATPESEFAYRDSTGVTRSPSKVSGCADPVPALQGAAGDLRTVMMAFDDPTGGGGELIYRPALADAGSWRIPARPA